jgi:mitochondrial Rho GTPase 1
VFYCVECSAKTQQNVEKTFEIAASVVLYPPQALLAHSPESPNIELSQTFIQALQRIFLLLDKNRDGVISDEELLSYQQRCQPKATLSGLKFLKEIISKREPQGLQGGGLNVNGFIMTHQLLAEKLKFEPIWQLLRAFGYANDLSLANSFLDPK